MAELPLNLPQLQNLIKRDPPSYVDEFRQHYDHFKAHMTVFEANPSQFSKNVCEQIMFLSQVSHCYKTELETFPQQIISLLRRHHSIMNPDVRVTMCRALILMRNKDLLSSSTLLELFFVLFRCQDKLLRKLLFHHIVTDIKNINAKHRNNVVNRTLQNFMYSMLKDPHAIAAKMSLDVMVELYKKHVWRDAKTVNVIVTACLSARAKIMATGVRFFLGADEENSDDDDSSDEEDKPTARKLILATGVAKKTNKRRKKLEKQLSKVKKMKKLKKKGRDNVPNFSALHLVHDPQEFAEQLFKRLESENHAFDLRLNILTLISRLIGVHELILYNFYPYVQRFLKPQQRDVTKLLMITAQATHEMVPADIIEPLLRGIADNFVTERNAGEVMAVGLNAAREIYLRCPLAMGDGTLLRDFVAYKTHRDRGVATAGRSLLSVARALNSDLLNRKDRGKPLVEEEADGSKDDVEFDDEDEGDGDMEDDSDVEDAGGEGKGDDSMQFIGADAGAEDGDESSDDEEVRKEIVTLEDIAMVNVKRRRDREARLATVIAGREGRAKFGGARPKMNPHASTTHKEKEKKKNYMMQRQKHRFDRSQRSFRDRQIATRKAMLKNKRGMK